MAKHKSQELHPRWHRRSGITSAFFVLVLAITGIALNHSRQLGLDSTYITSPTILRFYGTGAAELSSVQIDGRWLSKMDGKLYIDNRQMEECAGKFAGAVELEQFWVAACSEELLLYSYEQRLLKRFEPGSWVPFPVEQIGTCQAELCVASGGEVYQLDLKRLRRQQFSGEEGHFLLWSSPVEPPKHISSKLNGATGGVSWRQLILDIHASRYMGAIGPYVLDVIALLLIIFSITGIYMWFQGRRT